MPVSNAKIILDETIAPGARVVKRLTTDGEATLKVIWQMTNATSVNELNPNELTVQPYGAQATPEPIQGIVLRPSTTVVQGYNAATTTASLMATYDVRGFKSVSISTTNGQATPRNFRVHTYRENV